MRILFLQKRLLFPTDTGGKIRTLNVVRHLARWHSVHYLCNILEQEEPYRSEMEELGLTLEAIPWRETSRRSFRFALELVQNLFSPFPYNVNKDYDDRLRRRVEELAAAGSFDLVVCDFVQMARNVIGIDVPKVLFQHNVEAEIFERHAQVDRGLLRRAYMGLQAKKMFRFERDAGRDFDAVVAVSERDKKLYEERYDWRHVTPIDTAVDTDYFQPDEPDAHSPESPPKLVFVGSMDWLPNVDGTKYFVEEILPKVQSRIQNVEFRVVGRNPGDDILQLGNLPGVVVTGSVPDVRPELSAATVVVVPLRIGGGTRLKIYEAMAMQKAVISTSLGAEGLDVTHGRDILLADDAAAFADSAVELLQNAERRQTIARNAHDLVVKRFSTEPVARQFEAICKRAVGE